MKKIFYMMLLFLGIIPNFMCAADKEARAAKRERDETKKNAQLLKQAQKDALKNFDKDTTMPLSPKLARKLSRAASHSPTNLAIAVAALDQQKASKNDRLVTD